MPPLRRARREVLRLLSAFAAAAALACGGQPARGPSGAAPSLYDQGKYKEALPVLRQAYDAGERNGILLYQLGYCRQVVEGKTEERKTVWKEARPLLEKEVAATGGATLERLYYLTVICSDDQAYDGMTQYARQAVEQFEKGPDPNGLTGDDWFRLGRLHDFLQEASEAEASYRRALSSYRKSKGTGTAYEALTLAKVGDLDYHQARFADAADEYDRAVALLPENVQVNPFRHGLALLATGKFEPAAAAFATDRQEATVTESQYAADLARKAKEVSTLPDKDRDGAPIPGISDEMLQKRIQEASKQLRAVRTKNSMKPGDPLPAEVADAQRRFVSLLREVLIRRKAIQDFCLQENIADLVRR
jgi:tetratricopeptide (TPR) repeat protein